METTTEQEVTKSKAETTKTESAQTRRHSETREETK